MRDTHIVKFADAVPQLQVPNPKFYLSRLKCANMAFAQCKTTPSCTFRVLMVDEMPYVNNVRAKDHNGRLFPLCDVRKRHKATPWNAANLFGHLFCVPTARTPQLHSSYCL